MGRATRPHSSGELYGHGPLFTSLRTARGGAPRLRWDQLVWGWPPLLSPVSSVILAESAVRGRALWGSVGRAGAGEGRSQGVPMEELGPLLCLHSWTNTVNHKPLAEPEHARSDAPASTQ